MESMATTSPRWASPCGKGVSSRLTIRAGRSGSASWMRTLRAIIGPTPALSANAFSKVPKRTADAQAFTVVGVVGAVKQAASPTRQPKARSITHTPCARRRQIFVAVRASLPPESLGLTLQKVVRQIDPELPVNDLRSMDTRIADSLVAQRSPALLASYFLRDRPAADGRRHLWRIELRCGAAPPRDRRAHGFGRAARADTHVSSCLSLYACWPAA